MSDMERNKGKLKPTSIDCIRKEFPNADLDDLGWDTGSKFVCIKGKYFEVVWEVKSETEIPDFADVTNNKDGSIDFHTYHYNGGAHWTELLEEAVMYDD